ncbi:hypothetical protein NL676_017289 [Syzygium grande]|nr:hypothetical protein NL676_017289 [Syzygium grande]
MLLCCRYVTRLSSSSSSSSPFFMASSLSLSLSPGDARRNRKTGRRGWRRMNHSQPGFKLQTAPRAGRLATKKCESGCRPNVASRGRDDGNSDRSFPVNRNDALGDLDSGHCHAPEEFRASHHWVPIGWVRIRELVQTVQADSGWASQPIMFGDDEDDVTVADIATPYRETPVGPTWWCHVVADHPFVKSWLSNAQWLHPAISIALRDERNRWFDRKLKPRGQAGGSQTSGGKIPVSRRSHRASFSSSTLRLFLIHGGSRTVTPHSARSKSKSKMTPCETCCHSASPSTPTLVPDPHHYLALLDKRCATMRDLRILHAQLVKTGLSRRTLPASRALAFCASTSGDIDYAWRLFSRTRRPNLFIWNTMIRGLSRSSTPEDAISLGLARSGAQLHGRIVKLGLQDDPFIRNTVVHMYAHCGFLEEARLVFDGSSDCDVVAWNSMIMGLAKWGEIDEARRLFDQAPLRNAITWSSMTSGYVRNGRFVDAMKLFEEMQERGIEPNEFTLVSLLNASAHLGALKQGQWVHEYIKKSGTQLNAIVNTAIIDMYCRCGSIGKAYQVFRAATKKGLSCWNSMILGLARNGYAEEAIGLFSQLDSSDFKPDELHGRSAGTCGFLEEAEELIRSMPMDPDAIIWGSLLSGSANHGKADMAERAAKNMIKLDPNESCAYVLMSNVLAGSNQHEEALEPRFSMKMRKIEKEPGASLIEVEGEVHEFVAGGRLHPRVGEIYCLLDELRLILQDVG